MTLRNDRGRPRWPLALFLVLLFVALAGVFALGARQGSTMTATTTGHILDGRTHHGIRGRPDVCVGRLVFTVDGSEYGSSKNSSDSACPKDGSAAPVTVSYNPDDPTVFDTEGSQEVVLWILCGLSAAGAAWMAVLLVGSIRARRDRGAGATVAP